MTVNVVDQMCGSGKTCAAINLINQSPRSQKFIYVTPYLNEVERIRKECKFKTPNSPVKTYSLKRLLNRGENIVTTHSLFHLFDQGTIDLIANQDYTLIMDEVTDVIQICSITTPDRQTLFERYLEEPIDGEPLKWKESKADYKGRFEDIKRQVDMESIAMYSGKIMVWLFPVRIFKAFRKTYLLTYMFSGQMQKYYYDYHGIEYRYMSVVGDAPDNYRFVNGKAETDTSHYSSLLSIIDDYRLNKIGFEAGSLSKTWYDRNKDTILMQQLKNNTYNFFTNRNSDLTGEERLWTTFKDYKHQLKGKGYTKRFLSHNARATNDYSQTRAVAYLINKYMNPVLKQFFVANNIEIDEDAYALSEMIQFIWRSAIRNDEPVNVYIPSKRMRDLLINFVKGLDQRS